MRNNEYIPSYIETIDSVVGNMSQQMSILYLESDYPNVLDLVLDRKAGSYHLRRWLGITLWDSMEQAQKFHVARPLTAVYQDKNSYGVIESEEEYRKKQKIAEKEKNVYLRTDHFGKSQAVYFCGPDDETFRLQMTLVDGDPRKIYPGHTVDLNLLPEYKYFVGKNALHFKIDRKKENDEDSPIYYRCRFFYLTNADALSIDTLARMLQAFLEYKALYPDTKLVLTGVNRQIPDTLVGQVTLIRLSAPSFEDIQNRLEELLFSSQHTFSQKEIECFSRTLTGLTHLQLENVFAALGPNLVEELAHNANVLEGVVWRQKKMESEKERTLIYEKIEQAPGVVGVGGFSRWLNENLQDLAAPEEAEKYGVTPPRGAILAGVPGTGKSQMAKQLAYQWGNYSTENPKTVSFIEFKIGNLSSSKYGESEIKMDRFLSRISEQAPAVLFIDEVEKTFYRDESGKQGMHEVKKQQMGMLLSWLQEHKANIFTFMTTNDIDILPPELIRSGRLSERFFVFLPNYVELMSMLYIFLKEKAERKIFSNDFNEEILRKCTVIETHSVKYGRNPEEDSVLDKELSNAMKTGSLQNVLINLARYAINPGANQERKSVLATMKCPWDSWLNDPTVSMRTPFMTGADMKELVKNTVLRLRRKYPRKKWTGNDFAESMVECCCCPEFTPYGQSNLDKLVSLYLGCDYRDASANPLLPRFQFNANLGTFSKKGPYIQGTNPDNLYDQYLQQVLMREIEKAAGEKKREKDRQARKDRLEKAQEANLVFQEQQIERQRKQWIEDDKDKVARKNHEETVREYQRILLEKAKSGK